MLPEGADVPGFELPALVDGEKRRVALEEYLGDDVVILVFYPADFNPACDEESCDLDELDLFTMQKDVTILGISPDSVYSHRAFAAKYDLKVPLLSDTDGEVAQRYDIEFVDDIGQSIMERAVAVVDHDGTITYSWSTDDLTELPRVEGIKDALAETGGDDTAFARYRVGHAHYTEGRRAFTSAMESFQNTEWVMAQHDFQQAREEFEEAADRFDTAVRFVDDEALVPIYEGANEKATALWQAADWLTRSASAYSSGSGSKGQELRDDAEIPLSTVREYREPPDPDGEWPPDMENLTKTESDDHSILPTEPDVEDAALDVDIDEGPDDATLEVDTGGEGDGEAPETDEPEAVEAIASSDDTAPASGTDAEGATADADSGGDTDDDIDDDELAEIQAELAANNPESEPSVDELTEESTAIVEAPPMGDVEAETEESTSVADPPADATGQGTEPAGEPAAESVDEAADELDEKPDEEPADGIPSETVGQNVDENGPANGEVDQPVDAVDESVPDAADEPAAEAGEATVTDQSADEAAVDTPDDQPADDSHEETVAGSDEAGDERPGAESEERDDIDQSGEVETETDDADTSQEEEETDDGGLQLELAEPDPDPIDADGPPAPPVEESDEAPADGGPGADE